MANITVIQRKVNKGTVQPLSVRYSHPCPTTGKNQDFIVAVGKKCDTRHFKDGRVVGVADAPELNEAVQVVVTRMEKAKRSLEMGGHPLTVEHVKHFYHAMPVLAEKLERRYESFKEEGLSKIQVLEHELADLEAAVEAKKQEIVAVKLDIGIHKPVLFVELINSFIKAKTPAKVDGKAPVIGRKQRKGETFAAKTADSYTQLIKEVTGWKKKVSIHDFNKKLLENFEAYLIGRKYLNGTTFVYMQKMVAVLNYYQAEYNLDTDYRKYTFALKMPEESVIYLTKDELTAFRNVSTDAKTPVSRKKLNEVKDLALLMSETGLRFIDSHITKRDIKHGYIIKEQQKTGNKVSIPYTSRIQAIVEKHNYELRGKGVTNWNKNFRKLLALCPVPSLYEEVTVTNYCGDEPVDDTRPKYMHCSAHTLRRTMINQCLLRNLRYDKITKMTGHKNFDVFQTYVDRDTKAAEMDSVFDYLNEVDETLSVMRVVA